MRVWFLFLICLAGCASNLDRGVELIAQNDYQEAVKYLEAASEEGIDPIKTERNLAIAYYKNKQYRKAVEKLESVVKETPTDSIAHMYLGMTYEAEKLYEKAIEKYNEYIALCPFEKIREQFKARQELLRQKAIYQTVRNALESEDSLSVDRANSNTFAVKPFPKLYGRNELDVLGKGLADLLISDLKQIEEIEVVELTKMQYLVNDIKQKDGSFLLYEPENSPRVGKLLKAGKIITGTLEGTENEGESYLTITAVCSCIDGSKYRPVQIKGPLEEIFRLEKTLLTEILKQLGIEKPKELKHPTKNFDAFLSYSRGLDYMDKGFYDAAASEFQRAIEIDPEFSEKLTVAQNLSTAVKQELGKLEKAVVEAEKDMQATLKRSAKANSVLSKGFMKFPGSPYNAEDTSPKEEVESVPVEFKIKW